MSLPRRAIISITSATAPLHDGHPTGLFISEALHPYQVLTAAGFSVDLVSEKQTYTADWLSLQSDFLNGDDKATYEDLNSDFRKKLDNMQPVSSFNGKEYGLFFASAGHAALIDYPHASGLHKIASDIWNQGGIVAVVCHGAAILPGVIDKETGKSIGSGREFTGFTTEGESVMHIMDPIRSWNEPLIDEWAEKLGGKCECSIHSTKSITDHSIDTRSEGIWDDYYVIDGRLVSGMNPQSAKSTTVAAVQAFDKL
jgi:putative intracellular protease/amidase